MNGKPHGCDGVKVVVTIAIEVQGLDLEDLKNLPLLSAEPQQ
jgi:hypothetical protein